MIRLNTTPSRRDLRVFGLLGLLFCGLGGAFAWSRGSHVPALALWSVAILAAGPGLVHPPWLRPVYLAAIYATFPIGFVVSYVILGVVFYLVLTPIGLLMRLCGRDPLTRRFVAAQRSYWEPRDTARPSRSYFRQH